MKHSHFGHGTTGTDAPGAVVAHGRSYDVLHHVLFGGRRRGVFARLAALSGVHPGDRVLDVGCGTGNFTRVMADAAAPGGHGPGRGSLPRGPRTHTARHPPR